MKKYFLYALGEILLVVLGILIALQINNWNEGRKLNKTLTSALLEVREDLIQDTAELKRCLLIRNLDMKSQQRVIKVLQEKIPFNEQVYVDLARVMLKRTVYLLRNGFNLIEEIGISNLDDKVLRKGLVTYYGKYQLDLGTEMDDDEFEFENVWLPYVRDHFKEWDYDRIAFPKNDLQTLNDVSLLTSLKMNLSNLSGTIYALEAAISSAEQLIQSIDEKIIRDRVNPKISSYNHR